jgi:hypothetical protein
MPGTPTWNGGSALFIIAINSLTLRILRSGCSNSSDGAAAIRPMGAKSLRGS